VAAFIRLPMNRGPGRRETIAELRRLALFGRILTAVILGSLAGGEWIGISTVSLPLLWPQPWTADTSPQSLIEAALFGGVVLSIPIGVVFLVLGLPLYWLGRHTGHANMWTAATLGLVLGLLGTFAWSTPASRIRKRCVLFLRFHTAGRGSSRP
jgi:hypothetical protein